jgi:uncharacterized protein YjbJ (UPF0337 family)
MDINADQATGRVKQAVGDLTDNEQLKKEGNADESAGDAKEFLQGVEDKAEELVDKVKDTVHKD